MMNDMGYAKRKRLNILPVLIVLLLLATVIFFYTKNNPNGNKPDTTVVTPPEETEDSPDATEDREAASTPTVTLSPTPVPTLTPAPTPVPRDMDALKTELEGYLEEQEGKYGLYFINLVTGDEFGIRDRDEYIAASTTKLPMNLLLYKKIAAKEIDPESILTYQEEDFEAGTGIIQKSEFGTEYTVRETARLSIVYSDNCGINMIIRLLGIENIRAYMQKLGGTVYYGKRHRTCPYDLALYAQELYRFYLESPEIAGWLIEDLQGTMWNDRINKLLPEDIKVSHKIGNYPEVYNDVGIVFATEPYVLAVMSDGINQVVASDVIAQISKTIYDYLETSAP